MNKIEALRVAAQDIQPADLMRMHPAALKTLGTVTGELLDRVREQQLWFGQYDSSDQPGLEESMSAPTQRCRHANAPQPHSVRNLSALNTPEAKTDGL